MFYVHTIIQLVAWLGRWPVVGVDGLIGCREILKKKTSTLNMDQACNDRLSSYLLKGRVPFPRIQTFIQGLEQLSSLGGFWWEFRRDKSLTCCYRVSPPVVYVMLTICSDCSLCWDGGRWQRLPNSSLNFGSFEVCHFSYNGSTKTDVRRFGVWRSPIQRFHVSWSLGGWMVHDFCMGSNPVLPLDSFTAHKRVCNCSYVPVQIQLKSIADQ